MADTDMECFLKKVEDYGSELVNKKSGKEKYQLSVDLHYAIENIKLKIKSDEGRKIEEVHIESHTFSY